MQSENEQATGNTGELGGATPPADTNAEVPGESDAAARDPSDSGDLGDEDGVIFGGDSDDDNKPDGSGNKVATKPAAAASDPPDSGNPGDEDASSPTVLIDSDSDDDQPPGEVEKKPAGGANFDPKSVLLPPEVRSSPVSRSPPEERARRVTSDTDPVQLLYVYETTCESPWPGKLSHKADMWKAICPIDEWRRANPFPAHYRPGKFKEQAPGSIFGRLGCALGVKMRIPVSDDKVHDKHHSNGYNVFKFPTLVQLFGDIYYKAGGPHADEEALVDLINSKIGKIAYDRAIAGDVSQGALDSRNLLILPDLKESAWHDYYDSYAGRTESYEWRILLQSMLRIEFGAPVDPEYFAVVEFSLHLIYSRYAARRGKRLDLGWVHNFMKNDVDESKVSERMEAYSKKNRDYFQTSSRHHNDSRSRDYFQTSSRHHNDSRSRDYFQTSSRHHNDSRSRDYNDFRD